MKRTLHLFVALFAMVMLALPVRAQEVYTPTIDTEGEITVFYENTQNWDQVSVWAWNGSDIYTGGSWPGVAATEVGVAYNGNKIYKWTYSGELTNAPTHVIFNDGQQNNGAQTSNLTYQSGGYYVYINQTEEAGPKSVVTTSGIEGIYTPTIEDNEVAVFFELTERTKDWSSVKVYAWDENGDNAVAWPGQDATLVGVAANGNQIYKWTYEGELQLTKVIFNNGSGDQTADLTFVNGGFYTFQSTDGWTPSVVVVPETTYPETLYSCINVTYAALTTDAEGVYSGEITVAEGVAFAFADANTGEGTVYGPESEGVTLESGVAGLIVSGSTYTYSAAAGTYEVAINLTSNTITLTAKAVTPKYPEVLYLVGHFNNWNINANGDAISIAQSSTTPGYYEASNLSLTNPDGETCEVAISSILDSDNSLNWNSTFNTDRYGVPDNNDYVEVTTGTSLQIAGGQGNHSGYVVANGDYDVTIDLAAGTILFEDALTTGISKVEGKVVRPVALDGRIVLNGEARGMKVYTLGGALISNGATEVACPAGAYIVTVDGKAYKVIVR